MATHIEYTPSSSPAGVQQTTSFWVKRTELGAEQAIFEARQNNTNLSAMKFKSTDSFQMYSENGGTTNIMLVTNRKFRDPNAWYHIVVSVDTSQATASDRIKIYINGVQETSFSSSTYPSQNYDGFWFGIAQKQVIGRDNQGGGSEDFQGVLSHFHYSRGYVYQASTFGSTDSTTGEWKINTSPTLNYGATGWFVLKDGNSVTDQSGNSNNFTVGSGTLTKTEDNPSNVFATLNPLWKDTVSAGAMTYSNGNTSYYPNTNGNSFTRSTLGASSGKYYIEMKATEINTGQSSSMNIVPCDEYGSSVSSSGTYGFQIQLNSTNTQLKKQVEGSNTTINSSFSSGSIAMMAVDLDNGKMWIGYNGTWYNNNNPSSTLDVNNPDITGINTSVDYLIGFQAYMQGSYPSGYHNQVNVNFGNGYFGTTAVASAGTNASGIGIFEYDVPTGYTALSTKGLNT